MAIDVHPTAIIEPGAELDEGVRVGAYAYIGAQVKIGKGTVVMVRRRWGRAMKCTHMPMSAVRRMI